MKISEIMNFIQVICGKNIFVKLLYFELYNLKDTIYSIVDGIFF